MPYLIEHFTFGAHPISAVPRERRSRSVASLVGILRSQLLDPVTSLHAHCWSMLPPSATPGAPRFLLWMIPRCWSPGCAPLRNRVPDSQLDELFTVNSY